ncbi:hypothetical protein HU200_058910 [Digitaria exilis]|uniref:Uncharacterized protein n=1 Tax=Digitaria exilis TaxID=1010633 RepID=A0A835AGD7_9POAL|nr:hypothetical protein HU200_058910 [Digitaria exilis]
MESSAGTDMASTATVRPVAGDSDDEEEEARLWAELELLPTPQRARSAVVTLEEEEDDGEWVAGGACSCRKAVVDVGELGPRQRRALLDRLVGSVEHDNERFLRKLRERIDRVILGPLNWCSSGGGGHCKRKETIDNITEVFMGGLVLAQDLVGS